MDAVDLQRPELLPDALRALLKSIEALCRDEEFSEELLTHPEVRNVVIELDNYCMQRQVLGIHYTRAIRANIEQKGLVVRTGAEIRNEFVEQFGHIFEVAELEWLQNKWSSHQATQVKIRDSMLWFNFTLSAFGGLGSKYLLGMYGGEQINMGIEFDTPIGNKLASIGEPLVVKCALDPQKVRTSIEHPWGKILVSSFHLSIVPNAYRIDQDGRVLESILPRDLIVESACKSFGQADLAYLNFK
ncbi:MAG: hypothetical protein PHU06_04705 [Gallionella sp.]|nr:hypothetical protein [Gallionella sp.]MDD4959696.1 hypothetical protein [Gallionella sp.]